MNALVAFDAKAGLPAHIASFFGSPENSNIQDKVTVPSLTYEGKVWSISVAGEKTQLQRRNEDGDLEPIQIMRTIVLDYAKNRGRSYYPGEYDPAKAAAPVCWSDDGVTPAASLAEPQADRCAACPLAVKGSKVSAQGKAVTACSQNRMLAVVPANKLDFQPLRLKLATTSDFDRNNPEAEAKGWFAFRQYTDFLRSRGVQHSAAVVTKMRFDPNVAYPKVLFSPDRWLNAEELALVAPVAKSEQVQALLGGHWTPAGVDGVRVAPAPRPAPVVQIAPAPAPRPAPAVQTAPAPVVQPAAQRPVRQAAPVQPAPAPVQQADAWEDEGEAPAVQQPAPQPAQPAAPRRGRPPRQAAAQPQPAPVAPVQQAADDWGDEGGEPVAVVQPAARQAAPRQAAPATTPAAASVPDDVAALLDDWGEE